MDRLIAAIHCGDRELTELIILSERSSQPSFTLDVDVNLTTPLCTASSLDNVDIVALLLSHGASANFSVHFGTTPLHCACDKEERNRNNVLIVEELVSSGADVNAQDNTGQTPIHFACSSENIEIVECLIRSNALLDVTDIDEETPLVRACYVQNLELIKMLVENGCRADHPNSLPLSMCVSRGNIPAVKLFLEHGEEVQKKGSEYLGYACEFNHLDMMDYLHSLDVDINKRNTSIFKFTPLHIACVTKAVRIDVIQKLLSWGANVDTPSLTGDTPLHYSAQQLDLDKVKLLLQHGAPACVSDDIGLTPLTAALTSILDPSLMLCAIEIFVAAGCPITKQTIDVVKRYHSDNLDCLTDLFKYMDLLVYQPKCLKDICRIRIRETLGLRFKDCVSRLKLPKQLINYLQFGDILIPDVRKYYE